MGSDKTRHIITLVILILLLVALTVFMFLSHSTWQPAEWGSICDITAAAGIIVVFAAMFVTAVKLQRIMDFVDPEAVDFEPLPPDRHISNAALFTYLRHSPPRPFSPELFEPLYRGIMPKSIVMILWGMITLTLAVLLMTAGMLYIVGEDTRRLDREAVLTVWGEVSELSTHSTRNGRYVSVSYRYGVGDRTYRGISYADEAGSLQVGAKVRVECLKENFALSRIEGLRTVPMDLTHLRIMLVAVTAVLMPGLLLYFAYRKRWLKRLLLEGDLAVGEIISLRKGGRGMIFAKVVFDTGNGRIIRRLSYPLHPSIYEVLYNRKRMGEPVRLLIHSERFHYVYLIEPHLNSNGRG